MSYLDTATIRKDIHRYYRGVILCLVFFLICEILWDEICPLRLLFGLPCPACGMTRAFFYFVTFHFRTAFQMHPLIYLVILFLVLWCVNRYVKWHNKFQFITCKLLHFYGIILLGSIILYYIWRMYRYFPGEPPMDYHSHCLMNWLRGQ